MSTIRITPTPHHVYILGHRCHHDAILATIGTLLVYFPRKK
jgi:hypothetical protein